MSRGSIGVSAVGALAAHEVPELPVALGLDLAGREVDLHLHLLAGVHQLDAEAAVPARRDAHAAGPSAARAGRRPGAASPAPSATLSAARTIANIRRFEAGERPLSFHEPQASTIVASVSVPTISDTIQRQPRAATRWCGWAGWDRWRS